MKVRHYNLSFFFFFFSVISGHLSDEKLIKKVSNLNLRPEVFQDLAIGASLPWILSAVGRGNRDGRRKVRSLHLAVENKKLVFKSHKSTVTFSPLCIQFFKIPQIRRLSSEQCLSDCWSPYQFSRKEDVVSSNSTAACPRNECQA